MTQTTVNVVAHHVRLNGHGGAGLKPSDYRTLPLSDSEHKILHQIGEKEYWLSYKTNPEIEMCEYLLGYFETRYKSIRSDKLIDAMEKMFLSLDKGYE